MHLLSMNNTASQLLFHDLFCTKAETNARTHYFAAYTPLFYIHSVHQARINLSSLIPL
jgi:hypothetical protein